MNSVGFSKWVGLIVWVGFIMIMKGTSFCSVSVIYTVSAVSAILPFFLALSQAPSCNTHTHTHTHTHTGVINPNDHIAA